MNDTNTNTDNTNKPAAKKFPIKPLAILAGLILVIVFKKQVIFLLTAAATIAIVVFVAYALFAGVMLFGLKKPKEKYTPHFYKGCIGSALSIVCYLFIGWISGIVLPSAFDDKAIEQIRKSVYLMGLEDAVVAKTPDNALAIAYTLQTQDPATEAIAKSGSIMGATAAISPKGTVYTIGIHRDKPVVGIKAELSDVVKALENQNDSIKLPKKLTFYDSEQLTKIW